MSIWSKFCKNLSISFRDIPNPDDYEGEEILNYPFLKNDKGQFYIGSQYERIALERYRMERQNVFLREQREQFEKNKKMFERIHENLEHYYQEKEKFWNGEDDYIGYDLDNDDGIEIKKSDNSLKILKTDIKIGNIETKANFKKLPPFSMN